MSVLCPLCAQTSFSSIDALRCSLIKAANGPLACPICHEMFLGLDKLTIHLFSHTNIMNAAVVATTTTTSATTNNNNNSSVSEAVPASDTQNIKIKGKLKTKELKNLNKKLQTENIYSNNNNNNINCNSVSTNSPKNEINFENSHQHHHQQHNQIENEKILLKLSKVSTEIATNSVNSPTQQQVVALARQQTETKEFENLSTCDICEFTFRNEELKNMHIRLVHQNFDCHIAAGSSCSTSPINNNGIDHQTIVGEHEFKCHLCSKTFKMKGSLRVHLKVVHLMGLPYINNTPKLNICDRIRYKENKLLKSVNLANTNTKNTLQADNVPQHNTPTSTLVDMQPLNFISNLNSLPMASNVNLINLNQPVDFQQTLMDNSTLQPSNVLLVFNTAPSQELANNETQTLTSTSPVDKDASVKLSSTASGSLTENPKIWECDVCSKAFTTKYFLKKHKRLHTGTYN